MTAWFCTFPGLGIEAGVPILEGQGFQMMWPPYQDRDTQELRAMRRVFRGMI